MYGPNRKKEYRDFPLNEMRHREPTFFRSGARLALTSNARLRVSSGKRYDYGVFK